MKAKQNEEQSSKDKRLNCLDTQIAEEDKKGEAALELIALGNANIEATLSSSKINREEILKANMLLGNAIENSKIAENRISKLQGEKKIFTMNLKIVNLLKTNRKTCNLISRI